MLSAPNPESLFLSSFHELERFCHDSIFKLQRDIDDNNMALIPIFTSNGFNMTPDIEPRIRNIICLQKRISIVQDIVNHVRYILNSGISISSLPTQAPGTFEAILWILATFENKYFWQQIRNAIEMRYGGDMIHYLEQFKNINKIAFENFVKIEYNQNLARNYINQIKNMYVPNNQNNMAQPQQMPQNFYPPSNNYQQQNIQNMQNMNMAQAQRLPLQNSFSQNVNIQKDPYSMIDNLQPNGQQFKQRLDNINPKEEQKVNFINRSNSLDFNTKENGLQISFIKGVKKDNIEFYDQIQPALQAKGELFTDETFPPIPSSITPNVEQFPVAQQAVWKRIPEVYSNKKITVCSDQIGPNDILQGRLGNCFFLSALSALSEQKHYIQRLFHSRGISSTGCYSIWLCDSGEWKNIIIDDYVPCTAMKKGFVPRFAKSNGNDIWVLLLEKAYAKLYGSYYGTSTGFQGEALCALTGAPMKYFNLKKNNGIEPLDQLWFFIIGSLENKYVVTVSSKKESQTVNNKEMGVVSGHAYAVLDAKEVPLADGNRIRLVKMRNPWGRFEWNGDWGDKSAHWTEELRRYLNYVPKDDGMFWISLVDFNKHFYQPCVCKIHSNFRHSFVRLGENKKQSVFIAKMRVKSNGFAYIAAQQKRRKHFRGNPAYNYSQARILVAKTDENGQIMSFVHGRYKNHPIVGVKKNLAAGNYIVLIEVDWMQNFFNEIVLTAYSDVEIEFQEESTAKYNIPLLYAQIMRPLLLSDDPRLKRVQLNIKGRKSDVWKYSLPAGIGLGARLLVNRERENSFHYKGAVQDLVNMDVCYPYNNSLTPTLTFVVPPGEERLIVFKAKICKFGVSQYRYKCEESFALTQAYSREQLRELCKQKGKKIENFKKGQVQVFMFGYAGAIALYYLNQSTGSMLHEALAFDSQNVLINGEERSTLDVFVQAGGEMLVDVKVKNVFEKTQLNKVSKAQLIE